MAISNFAVLTKFKGLDQVSKPLDKMASKSRKFGNVTDKSFKKATKSAVKFRTVLGGILGANIISSGMMRLQMGAAAVTDEFVQFDQAATAAAAKFPDGVKRGTAAFKQLKTAARDVGATTKFTAAEAAEGLDFLAMAGFNSKQAIAAIGPAAELAAVGNMELARSTDIASDVLGAFQLKVDDSVQLTKNMTRVNDVMAKTITTANVDMEQLFETMKFGGPAAKAAGAEIETFSAIAATMGNIGIKGSMAGTAMRSMFTRLAKPAREARVLLKKLNVVVADGDGNFRDIFDILEDFNKATKDMGTKQKSAAIATVFGQRAISGVNAVLDKGSDGLREYRKMLQEANGTAAQMAADMNKGLGFRLKALQSAAIEVGFKFIDAFENKIPGAIESATAAIRNFDVKAVLQGIHKFILFLKNTKQLAIDLAPIILGVVGGLTAYHAIVKAIMIFKFVQMLWAAGAAMGSLNVIMAANPIGAIAVAIGLLITLITLLVQNWDTVSEVIQEFWIDTKIVFGKMWDWFKKMLDNPFFRGIARALNPFLEIPMMIIRNWDTVKSWFTDFFAWLKPGFEWMKKGLAFAAEKLGFGGDDKQAADQKTRRAPNEKQVASKSQIDFMGKMMFENAPPGARVESETRGAPPIIMDLAGQN
jgi:TP901 family phage tail tape measure protein